MIVRTLKKLNGNKSGNSVKHRLCGIQFQPVPRNRVAVLSVRALQPILIAINLLIKYNLLSTPPILCYTPFSSQAWSILTMKVKIRIIVEAVSRQMDMGLMVGQRAGRPMGELSAPMHHMGMLLAQELRNLITL